MKKVVGVYRNQNMHWVGDGFPVKNLFSYDRLGQVISPFLLLDYAAPYAFKSTTAQLGVGSHPHRGFETVTLAYQGEVSHQDSHGGGGTIKSGDVQWMTAGAGLMHEEFHSKAFAEQGGIFEMVQLWVNLPAVDKMTTPKYQAITAEKIATLALDTQGSQLRVIAGAYADQQGAATTFSPVNVWDLQLKSGSSHDFQVPVDHNTLLVVLAGSVMINNNQVVKDHSVVLFAQDADPALQIDALSDVKCLILTGKPLNEPIQGHGPFVMNSQAEIIAAFDDFNQGKFGQVAVDA